MYLIVNMGLRVNFTKKYSNRDSGMINLVFELRIKNVFVTCDISVSSPKIIMKKK